MAQTTFNLYTYFYFILNKKNVSTCKSLRCHLHCLSSCPQIGCWSSKRIRIYWCICKNVPRYVREYHYLKTKCLSWFILFQQKVQETLPENVLKAIHAPPKPDLPIIKPEQLTEADGIIFGFPTRYTSLFDMCSLI